MMIKQRHYEVENAGFPEGRMGWVVFRRIVSSYVILGLMVSVTLADDRREQSRVISETLGQRLKSQLMAAMHAGDPVAAIESCYVVAPALAKDVGTQANAQVGRTSLRLRSPDNAPDAWQRQQLISLQQRLDNGETWDTLETFEVLDNGGARYLKAIPVQAPCLTCHGSDLAPAIAARLHDLYPDDAATGYALGQLRGAFVVDWPATAP